MSLRGGLCVGGGERRRQKRPQGWRAQAVRVGPAPGSAFREEGTLPAPLGGPAQAIAPSPRGVWALAWGLRVSQAGPGEAQISGWRRARGQGRGLGARRGLDLEAELASSRAREGAGLTPAGGAGG